MTDTGNGERKSKKGLKKMSDEEKVRRSQDAVGGEDTSSHVSEAGSVEVNVDGETEMRERKICWNCHDTENLLKCGGCQKACSVVAGVGFSPPRSVNLPLCLLGSGKR